MDEKTMTKIYGQSDIALQCINKNFISLQDEERKTCVYHFRQVLDKLVLEMKKQDTLFAALYERVCGAGSYFDGLRVSQANEFDMDIVMRLPVNYNEMIIENENVPPAFVKVKITKALDVLQQHPRWTSDYRGMSNWRSSDGYLLQTKFRTWMEGVVNKALNTLQKVDANRSELVLTRNVPNGEEEVKYIISMRKSGPAMTLNISMPGDLPAVDVDLVPVIEFKYPQWPSKPVRKLDPEMTKKRLSWFIVPKPKNGSSFEDYYWRLAFHDQEREMLHGKGGLKPVCRLLKKFRDIRQMSLVASYYIKTLFLWEVYENRGPELWQKSLTKLFFHMLEKFQQSMKDGCINYFWDKRYNLLEGMTSSQFKIYDGNIANALKIMNKTFMGNSENENGDPAVLAKYLLTPIEMEKFSTLQISLGIQEQSSPRLLASSSGINKVKNEVQNGGQSKADNQETTLQEMRKMMSQMQKTILHTNEIVVQVLERVGNLEGRLDDHLAKLMVLEDELKMLKQSRLPLTEGQLGVVDFLSRNSKH